MSEELVLKARGLCKGFRIPSERRDTIREHALSLFSRRTFRRLTVLDGIDVDVRRGEILGIAGRNGCGKSTLLKILAGIYLPDAGSVDVRGAVTPVLELGIGWNPELDAVDNIALMATVMGMTLHETGEATPGILEFAGVGDFARLPLKHYSSGMAGRLAQAVAFRAARDVLLLDEVLAVGDAGFRDRCVERFQQLHRSGTSIVLVTHDPDFLRRFASRARSSWRRGACFRRERVRRLPRAICGSSPEREQPRDSVGGRRRRAMPRWPFGSKARPRGWHEGVGRPSPATRYRGEASSERICSSSTESISAEGLSSSERSAACMARYAT